MTVQGNISLILYWYEGLPGWQQLLADIPSVPINTKIYIGVGWMNTGTEDFDGFVGLTITRPDTTTADLIAIAGQFESATPGTGKIVEFEPVILDQVGTYTGTAILKQVTEEAEFPILDTYIFILAAVAVGLLDIDISALMSMMIIVMMIGIMGDMIK